MRAPGVPREALAHAEQTARELFPGRAVKALWTPASAASDVCVEIAHNGGAKVIPWANGAPACL